MTATATPLATNPVAIFLIVLLIILLAPVLLNRLKIPHIIGMIVAGVIVGPHGFNVLANDSSFSIFGQVGLLYLMFLAGLEIDMFHLRLNLRRGLLFGILTFAVPMVMGVLSGVYLLGIGWLTSFLLASMYASHTLISYPVITRLGVTKAPAVLISIVGTIIAVIGALLVLAASIDIHDTGRFDISRMLWLLGKLGAYCAAVLYVYPRVTRFFFKHNSDLVIQFVFILAAVFMSAYISGMIGLEPVLGAFFAGLVLNRFVPNTSSLMGRIEFVGNALFIPYFLIGVGMMIDIRVIMEGHTLAITGIMLAVALSSKWVAALAAQRCYGMDSASRRVMFGLTTAHTAVALAVVTIGYNMTDASGHRLMDATILNGTVLVILITCAIAPIVTSSAAQRLKIDMLERGDCDTQRNRRRVNTLVPLANPVTIPPLIELAIMMRGTVDERDSDSLYALHVRNDNSARSRTMGVNAIEMACTAAAAQGVTLSTIERYDLNTVTGIANVISERDIDEVILGMHRRATVIDSFLGAKIEQLLAMTPRMVTISRCYIPINTVSRIIVHMPDKAQFETGFARWVAAVANIARTLGCRMIVCCRRSQQQWVSGIVNARRTGVRLEYRDIVESADFIILSNRIEENDLFVIAMARPNSVSYSNDMVEIPGYLQRYCSSTNLLVIYPGQFGEAPATESFADPMLTELNRTPSPWIQRLRVTLRKLRRFNPHQRHPDRLKL